jgi:hypothetical protein
VLQDTELVTSEVVLLPKVAVAEYCWVTPGATVVFNGAIANEVIVVEEGKNCPQPMEAANTPRTSAVARRYEYLCTKSIVTLDRAIERRG